MQPTPLPAGASNGTLSGVQCWSASSCIAVGDTNQGSDYQPLAEHWNGSAWTVQPTAKPATRQTLQAISCPSTTVCTGVGTVAPKGVPHEQPLAEQHQ